jgi:ribonuclease BN (tRNA processing enzyme)
MSNSRIIILGSSSGMPSGQRSCSSFVLETESGAYLFDAGEGISSSVLKHKVDYKKISTIFITHTHSDHLIGLFLLIQMMHLVRRKEKLDIYLPEEAISPVRTFLNTLYLFPEKLSFDLNFYRIKGGFFFEDRKLKVKAFLNSHLRENQKIIEEKMLKNRSESFCFEISLDNKKIIYSGDVDGLNDLAPILSDAEVFITECMHLDLFELLSLVKRYDIGSTIFTHIPSELEKYKEKIINQAKILRIKNSLVPTMGRL